MVWGMLCTCTVHHILMKGKDFLLFSTSVVWNVDGLECAGFKLVRDMKESGY